MNKEKKEKITAEEAFQLMNMFLNRPCRRLASEIKNVLPQINHIALYYRNIKRTLSVSERATVELFLREHQKVLELLPVFLERKEIPYRGLEIEAIC